ncbi:MAG: hypothetical protein ACI4EI_09195 [Muricoprocola sp.]
MEKMKEGIRMRKLTEEQRKKVLDFIGSTDEEFSERYLKQSGKGKFLKEDAKVSMESVK